GAGVYVTARTDPKLTVGDEVELRFEAESRSNAVRVHGRVMSAKIGLSGVRYGLQFLRVADIHAQLDSFYARWFNRRKDVRVLPDLAHELRARLTCLGVDLDICIHDISMGGMGLLVSAGD